MMQGLTQQEAKNRLRQDGKNELAEAPKSKPVRMFLGQFRDVMVMILLAATMVSVLLGEWTDAITIILIVLLNAILGFIQEFRTERTLETLRQMTAPTAAVCRDGTWQTISAAELVRGDLIRLEAGDRVPADAALVTASGIAANESILTGESAAVSKIAGAETDTDNALHKKNVVYAGTAILRRLCHCLRHCNGHKNADGTDFRLAARCHSFSNTAAKTSCRTGKSRCIALHCRVYSGLFRRSFPRRTDF